MELFLLILICSSALLSANYFIRFARTKRLSARTWIFGISSIIFIPFGLAWCVTSFGEGEPFAGYMGLAVFTGFGITLGLLAYTSLPKRKQSVATTPAESTVGDNVGLRVLISVLVMVGAALLPLTLTSLHVARTLAEKASATRVLNENILSDQALPKFIKHALAYETLYGPYPETLEVRMGQSMVSGVSDEEFIALLDRVMPEPDRLNLLHQSAAAITQWYSSGQDYPELTIAVSPIIKRAMSHSEFLIGWIYKNFSFPPMDTTRVAQFIAGEFPDDFQAYMGTPPDSLRTLLISKGALALERQLATLEAPEQLVLSDLMQEQLTPKQAAKQKSSLRWMVAAMKNLWCLPVTILVVALALVNWKLPHKLKWNGYLAMATAAIGWLLIIPLRDIDGLVYVLVEGLAGSVHSAAMAFLDLFLPSFLSDLKSLLYPLYSILLVGGCLLIATTFRAWLWLQTKCLFTLLSNAADKKSTRTQRG